MDERPEHWRGYVAKGADERLLRLYGLSDRVRYYWPEPDVQASLSRLFHSVDVFASLRVSFRSSLAKCCSIAPNRRCPSASSPRKWELLSPDIAAPLRAIRKGAHRSKLDKAAVDDRRLL